MKILFKNITDYTKENCNDFKKFHINKYAKKEMFKYIIVAIVFIYMLISNIIYKNWILFLSIIIICISVILFRKYKPVFKKKIDKALKKRECDKYKYKPIDDNVQRPISVEQSLMVYNKRRSIFKNKKVSKEYIFYFYDNYMKIKNKRLSKKVWYFKFKRVFETDKYFFMYVDDKEPWMLEKNGFVIGNAEKFTEFIKSKCLFRYKDEQ